MLIHISFRSIICAMGDGKEITLPDIGIENITSFKYIIVTSSASFTITRP